MLAQEAALKDWYQSPRRRVGTPFRWSSEEIVPRHTDHFAASSYVDSPAR